MTKQQWEEITEEVFNNLFRKSPMQRTKFNGIKRNVAFIVKEDQSLQSVPSNE
jgi:epoxyqueuosine reductase